MVIIRGVNKSVPKTPKPVVLNIKLKNIPIFSKAQTIAYNPPNNGLADISEATLEESVVEAPVKSSDIFR